MPVSVMLTQPLILSSLTVSRARLTERVSRLRSVTAVLEREREASRGQLELSLLTPPSVRPTVRLLQSQSGVRSSEIMFGRNYSFSLFKAHYMSLCHEGKKCP